MYFEVYLYFILHINIMLAKSRVKALAKATGTSWVAMP